MSENIPRSIEEQVSPAAVRYKAIDMAIGGLLVCFDNGCPFIDECAPGGCRALAELREANAMPVSNFECICPKCGLRHGICEPVFPGEEF